MIMISRAIRRRPPRRRLGIGNGAVGENFRHMSTLSLA